MRIDKRKTRLSIMYKMMIESRAFVFLCLIELQSLLYVEAAVPTAKTMDGSLIFLPCDYDITPSVTTIAWQYNYSKIPFATIDITKQNSSSAIPKTTVNDEKFMGRININSANGDLSIDPVKPSDAGVYHCFVMHSFVPDEAGTFNLSVQVFPSDIEMNCFDAKDINNPKDCSELIEGEDISVSCSVTSSPKANLIWKVPKASCAAAKETNNCMQQDYVWMCTSTIQKACKGEYTCQTVFNGVIVQTQAINIGQSVFKEEKNIIWIIIGVVIPVVFIVICICVTCVVLKRKGGKSNNFRNESLSLEKSLVENLDKMENGNNDENPVYEQFERIKATVVNNPDNRENDVGGGKNTQNSNSGQNNSSGSLQPVDNDAEVNFPDLVSTLGKNSKQCNSDENVPSTSTKKKDKSKSSLQSSKKDAGLLNDPDDWVHVDLGKKKQEKKSDDLKSNNENLDENKVTSDGDDDNDDHNCDENKPLKDDSNMAVVPSTPQMPPGININASVGMNEFQNLVWLQSNVKKLKYTKVTPDGVARMYEVEKTGDGKNRLKESVRVEEIAE